MLFRLREQPVVRQLVELTADDLTVSAPCSRQREVNQADLHALALHVKLFSLKGELQRFAPCRNLLQ
jgi:hypothetical protein